MTASPLRRAALLLLAASACATAPVVGRPEGPVVRSIVIEGTDALSAGDLKKKILTSESDWWPFGAESRFDASAWFADLRRIERYYQARGYYAARVVETEEVTLKDGSLELRATVKEGPPTRIAAVQVRGLEALPEAQRAKWLKALPLQEGEPFLEESWGEAKGQLQAALREAGFADATVGGEVHVDLGGEKATVLLEAEPGRRYRFGRIFVSTGDRAKVPVARIAEQAQSALPSDGWYSDSALAEAQQRVFRMGVFGAVKVNRGAPDQQNGTVPVVVDVREAPLHSLKGGVGAGLDPARYEVRGTAEYTDRNFFGGLRRLTVRGKLGYALLINNGLVGTIANGAEGSGPIFNAQVELEQPQFLRPDLKLQGSVSAERTLDLAYTSLGGKLKVGVVWQPRPDLSIYPSYNLEMYLLRGSATLQSGSPTLALGCQPDATGQCPLIALSYLEQLIEWDRRDDRNEPRRGFYLALSLQEGGGPLQGAFSYLRVLPEGRYYHSVLDDRLTFAAKLKLGTLLPLRSESPIVARFFSGGGNAMRGFGGRRLSPLQAVAVPPAQRETPDGFAAPIGQVEGETVPIGGDGLFEGSFEVRYALSPSWVLALFLDVGFVSVESLGMEEGRFRLGSISERMEYAVGVGVRYLTVVGPIRADFAYRPNLGPPLPVIPPRGYFYPGRTGGCLGLLPTSGTYAGAPEDRCAFFLSIGEAF